MRDQHCLSLQYSQTTVGDFGRSARVDSAWVAPANSKYRHTGLSENRSPAGGKNPKYKAGLRSRGSVNTARLLFALTICIVPSSSWKSLYASTASGGCAVSFSQ